jgi:hypothetical protein
MAAMKHSPPLATAFARARGGVETVEDDSGIREAERLAAHMVA